MVKPISIRELQTLQRGKEEFALISVLSETDFQRASIYGSTNVPLDSPDFLQSVEKQTAGDKHKRVVVYCAGSKCDASTRAANKLAAAGYTHVEDYRGGIDEWNASQSGGRGQVKSG
ncbi:MAG TPA: rhodanese-like domain-containing protein [Planctomycetota bacterium]|nr:rhodanese-like domain-containing protein [Planctomycetota bacterium]